MGAWTGWFAGSLNRSLSSVVSPMTRRGCNGEPAYGPESLYPGAGGQ
jgi:hypothetical protein